MARALYRSITCNIYMFDPAGQQANTIREAWKRADVLKLNEGHDTSTGGVLRGLAGASFYRPGSNVGLNNPIIWRDSVFQRLASGYKMVYNGGDGWGPPRGVTWVLLKHKATGKRVLEFNYHNIARAWTDKPARLSTWNSIQNGVGAEVDRVMGIYPGVPAVISGDVNKPDNDGPVTFPHINEVNVSTPDSFGNNRYDQFFIVGPGIAAKASYAFTTMSDHKSVGVNFEITTAVVDTTPPKPAPPKVPTPTASGVTPTPRPAPVVPKPSRAVPEDLRRRSTYRKKPEWRFFAQRMLGDGSDGELLHTDLPLADVEIEDMLTGHNSLSGTISPEFASLRAEDGRPILDEWGTAIWAEESGLIHGGGILTNSGFEGPDWNIECVGLTGYLAGLPYASANFFVEADPLNIFRHIWAHVQAQPGGNVGLEVDPLLTGLRIGTVLTQVEFDTVNGPVSFEAGPYKLAWYQDHDLADKADSLASDTPFDWHEEHYWTGDVLHHRLKLGYPQLGGKRTDLRFVLGENIIVKPGIDRDGADYADEAWALGAGEGSAMLRGVARKDIARLRRVAVIADPSKRTQTGVNTLAARELGWRNRLETITEVVVRDHPHADIGSVQVGDEISIQGEPGWLTLDGWYRVVSRRIKPFSPDQMVLSLVRTDKISA